MIWVKAMIQNVSNKPTKYIMHQRGFQASLATVDTKMKSEQVYPCSMVKGIQIGLLL
jgi:hypothetical protein